MANVFTYGSLTLPEVMELVAGASYSSARARIDGYSCSMLRGKRYPGIVESPGNTTEGIVFKDVSEDSLKRIDYFEDDIYERQSVTVVTDEDTFEAWAYVLPSTASDALEGTPWDANWFRREHLEDYLSSASKYMKGFS